MNSVFLSRLAAPLLWLVVGLVALAAAGQALRVDAQTSATPRPTSSPTASPADLRLANRFAELGEFDQAAGSYNAIITRGTAGERLIARIGLAKLLLDDGQNAEALRHLDAYLIEAPESDDVSGVQLLMAEGLKAERQYSEAISLYEAHIQRNGAVAVYAQMGRAEALALLGAADASSAGESVLDSNLPKSTRLRFITTMAQALESELPQEALTWYERLGRESDDTDDKALALWRSGLLQFVLRPTVDFAMVPNTLEVIQRYPDSPSAQEAVDRLPTGLNTPSGRAIDPYYTGLVFYQAGEIRVTREDFLDSLSLNQSVDPTLAARSSFYLAVLDERANNFRSAIERYGDVLELDPSVDLADDALWWQGRAYEQERQPGPAGAVYERILSSYSGSGYASEARFRLAVLSYDEGDFEEAAEAFAQIADSSRNEEKQRALLWQGKALAEAGDDEAAGDIWRSVAKAAPHDYYGLRGAVLLGDAEGNLRDAPIDNSDEPDWAAMQAWLTETGAGDPTAAQQAFAGNERWDAGRALLALGMEQQAGAEFNEVLQSSLGDPNMQLLLARQFKEVGQHDLSARAMARLVADVPDEALATAPKDIWKLAYPTPYAEALNDAAEEFDVPNVLLLALVRQESFFDPLAGSAAGAIGLTQVVEPTGEAIARELDASGFETDHLYRPSVSLRFGARYLRAQLDLLDDNFYYALAAYNGGPGNAQRWAEPVEDDIDRFVAEIEFSQTEAYVKLVSENLARYRQVYQGLAEPALPKD